METFISHLTTFLRVTMEKYSTLTTDRTGNHVNKFSKFFTPSDFFALNSKMSQIFIFWGSFSLSSFHIFVFIVFHYFNKPKHIF